MTTPVQTIFDLGMHNANDTSFYLHKGFRVVAVDANPGSTARARAFLADAVRAGSLEIVNRAIADEPGEIDFYVCEDRDYLSTADPALVKQWKRDGAQFTLVKVPTLGVKDLMDAYGTPHYLKLDIEGFDLLALRQLRALPQRPAYVSAELDLKHCFDMLNTLSAMGYDRFQLIRQSQVPKQVEPRPPREGRHSGVALHLGHTGLFGGDLPRRWRSSLVMRLALMLLRVECIAAEAFRRIDRLLGARGHFSRLSQRAFPRGSDWFDIHARYREAP